SLRHWQAGVILIRQRALGRDAEAFQHRDDLARVLRRMPGAALHDVMQRLLAVVGCHLAARDARTVAIPPALQPLSYALAIVPYLTDGSDIGRRRRVVDRGQVLHAVLHR